LFRSQPEFSGFSLQGTEARGVQLKRDGHRITPFRYRR
jgi:hypothetical protein